MKANGSGELAGAARILAGKFSACIQQVDYPIHKGQPNPCHGMFFFVGSDAALWQAFRDKALSTGQTPKQVLLQLIAEYVKGKE